jgi:molybdenum cofactor biosynthesis enzyme MoaA
VIPESNELRLEVTTKCNYSCIICPRDELTRNIETMGIDLFKDISVQGNIDRLSFNIS